MRLDDSTALVTGGAKRLGGATCMALAKAGANVVVHYGTSHDEAEALAERIRQLGRKAWTIQADLADREAAASLIGQATELAGSIDILINNASIFPNDGLLDCTPEAIHANVDVNALAPLALGRALAAQGRSGAIVNFLDARAGDYDRKHLSYHLSKRMLAAITRMMAVEFAPDIRVNAIAPGLILPPPGEDEAYLDRLAHTNPLNRHGGVEDIASAVLFLLQSPFVTGQTIYVDGGRHLRGNMYE